jgi:hypothetical protein
MLAGMTAGEMAEWEAFFALEPWGGLRDDLRAATVAATVANSAPFRGPGKGRKPADFFATLAPPRKRPGRAELAEKLNAFFGGIGGG